MSSDSQPLQVYLSHRAELLGYASRIVGCRARAEDVLQEAYLRFADTALQRTLDNPTGYLYRIVRNLAVALSRRLSLENRHWAEQALAEDDLQSSDSPQVLAEQTAELSVLAAALAELPERTRTALEMHRLGGRKLKEIAAHLGISVALAHALVFQGLEHCRRRMHDPS